MVERVNGTIKKGTILKENYSDIYIEHSRNKEEMNSALISFLVHYMLYRRHGSLRKELNIKTPFNAVEKPVVSKAEPWFELKLFRPEISCQVNITIHNQCFMHYY